MTNKGYYGWIHSLNAAGIQAHQKGIEMLAEQHARKGEMLTEAKKPNRTEAGKAQQAAYHKNRRALEAQANELLKKNPGEFIDQGAAQTRAEIHSAGMRAGSGTKRVEGGFRKGKAVSTDEIDLTPDDGSETGEHSGTEEITRLPNYGALTNNARAETLELLKQQELTKRSSAPSDVDKDGDVDAHDVVKDVKDGKIDRVALDAPPPTRVHPPAEFQSFGQADWQVAKLNGYQDPTESQLDDQSTRHLTMPRRAPYTESVSQKIARFLRN